MDRVTQAAHQIASALYFLDPSLRGNALLEASEFLANGNGCHVARFLKSAAIEHGVKPENKAEPLTVEDWAAMHDYEPVPSLAQVRYVNEFHGVRDFPSPVADKSIKTLQSNVEVIAKREPEKKQGVSSND